jgi:superfamily II DNA/RNA helicase
MIHLHMMIVIITNNLKDFVLCASIYENAFTSGQSVMLHAMTGSGKTLAFLLPLMARVSRKPKQPVQVIITVPTRELAVQIAREAVLLGGGQTSSVELIVDAQVNHAYILEFFAAFIVCIF